MIVQEAMTNVLKHAHARAVELSLEFRRRSLRLAVTDDGRGFARSDHAGSALEHFGLLGMRERAAAIGGRCSVRSVPDRGTVVELITLHACYE
jgi:signal transduction histidine kinase